MSSNTFSLASKVKLPNGKLMPQLQLGLYMMSGREATQSVRWALSAGYRGFDSAQMYHNEREAGIAIRDYLADNTEGLSREDVFYTSKLASSSSNYQAVRKSIRQSVDACGLGYIDLFLLHSPYGGREARLTSWRAVEDAITDGEVVSGGVSNYGVGHIEELMSSQPRIPPAVNQIEVHPFNTREDIRAACAKHGIVVEAYAPLARAMRMRHPVIVELAKKYSCSPAQLLVRWSLQHGLVPLPKSVKRERLLENVNVGFIEISDADMQRMDQLDEVLVTDWDPTDAP
ncbi:Uu.00g037860.m01.CDS01 [Anthostomella pinea]|uniref:Uu.00g037860.m01.CDS01 n=1 Tax=Anthostomella pinea TaxID=933095 RepID=A0AAI8V4S7_9PEZI|nr:Uu.00g037860.m01.CDS01 [Anthostomella pinea]